MFQEFWAKRGGTIIGQSLHARKMSLFNPEYRAFASAILVGVLAGMLSSPEVANASHGPIIDNTVTAQISIPLGVSPDEEGNNFNYVYSVNDGDSVVD